MPSYYPSSMKKLSLKELNSIQGVHRKSCLICGKQVKQFSQSETE